MQTHRSLPVLCAVAALWTGCSGLPSVSPSLLQPAASVARDGAFHYRVPIGWVDATADSQAVGHAVWLLRNDYGATIAVSEIHLDADARNTLRAEGIMHLARLTMVLAAGAASYTVNQQPEPMQLNGRDACVFALTTLPAHDRLRAIVVDSGGKVYMITALVPPETERGVQNGVFAVQDAFASGIRW